MNLQPTPLLICTACVRSVCCVDFPHIRNVHQDLGILGGDYNDFERGWYATVGVAVAMTMLINVIVPHATPLVG